MKLKSKMLLLVLSLSAFINLPRLTMASNAPTSLTLSLSWAPSLSPNVTKYSIFAATNNPSVNAFVFYDFTNFTSTNGVMGGLASGLTNYFFGQAWNSQGLSSPLVFEGSESGFRAETYFNLVHAGTNFWQQNCTNAMQFFKLQSGALWTSPDLVHWSNLAACPSNCLMNFNHTWLTIP
jgi:hypothetical protein